MKKLAPSFADPEARGDVCVPGFQCALPTGGGGGRPSSLSTDLLKISHMSSGLGTEIRKARGNGTRVTRCKWKEQRFGSLLVETTETADGLRRKRARGESQVSGCKSPGERQKPGTRSLLLHFDVVILSSAQDYDASLWVLLARVTVHRELAP